ncbi:sensor domain-containing diguanylate cyclase [Pseudomonas fluorescens]|uniref:sensor domain-containing diguanylate cyclase n=1 Tax=Pseudomonas fluorescens TaxID=294 RepID=UPI003F9525BC
MPLHVARPKILGLINEDASAWLIALLALMVGGLLTGLLAWATLSAQHQQVVQRFQLLASERKSRIAERFQDQEQRLASLRRFFVNTQRVSREEFDGYTQPLLQRSQAYGWAPLISHDQRAAFEQEVREEGIKDFSIIDLDAMGRAQVADQRAEYAPLLYKQTLAVPAAPLGTDLLAQPARRAVLQRAREQGAMVVSQPMQINGVEPPFSRGVLLVEPVMRKGLPDREVGIPAGYVMALINMRQLVADGFPSSEQDDLVVDIIGRAANGQREAFYESTNAAARNPLHYAAMLRFGDQVYDLDIQASAAFERANQPPFVSLVVMGGLLSLLLSALLYSLVSQRQRALALVERRTRELHLREQELRRAHAQLRGLLDAATQVAIIATDLRGVITTFNAGAEQMLGYHSSEVLGRVTLESLHLPKELEVRAAELGQRYGKSVPACQAMLVADAKEPGHVPREWTLVRADGSHLAVNMLATAVLDDQGLWVGHLAICIDITERKRVHETLAARDLLLKKLSAHVPGGIYQFMMAADGHFSVIYASDGIRDIYELEPEVLLKHAETIFERIHPLDVSRVRGSIYQSSQKLTPWREEYRVLLPSLGLRWVRGEATPEELPGGGVLWHGYISDISDMKRVEDELRALSVTDALTGVHNRRYFQERLTLEMARVSRGSGDLAVIMLDIDHFKAINDCHGHAAGDRVLQVVCERIGHRLRRTDVFCRLGGEEFMVLCPDTDGHQAYSLALELWLSLRTLPFDGVGTVTASFGIASWRAPEGADDMLLRADSGVYAAKQAGRDRVEEELP